jgi:hypothetical protein
MAKKKIDKGYLHETMDRISIINSNLDDFVIKHVDIPIVNKKVKKAQKLLSEAYQELGQYM